MWLLTMNIGSVFDNASGFCFFAVCVYNISSSHVFSNVVESDLW